MATERWDKVKIIGTIFASIFIPVVLAYVGNQFNSSLKQAERQVQYIQMATDILSDEPSPDNQHLREWAINVVNAYSEIPLEGEAAKQLKSKLSLPKATLSDRVLQDAINSARRTNDGEALRVFRRYMPARVGGS